MGFETIPETEIQYGLISEALIRKAVTESITNVFFFCHGWQGDLPGAKAQYNAWLKTFMSSADRKQASQVFPKFQPLLIGLHWPSKPWGDEELGTATFGVSASGLNPEDLLRVYLDRLGDRPEIRRPLEIIIDEARRNPAPQQLPPPVRQAYLELNDALGLGSEGVDAPPDADREGFDPQDAFDLGNQEGTSFGGGINLGGLLGPLRQLSYWTMKKRARTIGEGGMHNFLNQLQQATAGQKTRIHLMGHSFGTIVVSGMVGGPNAQGPLPRPVDSVALVQGAVSLWCYARQIPFNGAGAGYFSPILRDGKIHGPLITTRSKFDYAVGRFYPIASRLNGSPDFAGPLPKFGGVGTYGIQGVPDNILNDLAMKSAMDTYAFDKAKAYNLDGSQYICHLDGASGAHCDIAGPEVAHAIWAATLASA
jgi:hypothetical protein